MELFVESGAGIYQNCFCFQFANQYPSIVLECFYVRYFTFAATISSNMEKNATEIKDSNLKKYDDSL